MPVSALVLNGALSQEDRLALATPPTRVQVDDRSLAELLRLSVDHGQLITFFDLTNAPDQDWSDFFAADPAIALAMQASLDPRAIEEEMQALGQRLRHGTRPLVRPEPWRELVDLIRQLLTTLRRSPLRPGPLAVLLHQVDRPDALVETATNLSRFLESTGLDLRLGQQAILLKESELRRLENLLRDFLGVLLATLEAVRVDAEQELEVQLRTSGHPPHVALYIAFARLFQFIQGRVNQLPEALLRFYHQTVLRQDGIADNALQRDRLILTFHRKPTADLALVPAQTPFSAGVDAAGLPIVFTSDQDLEVQGSSVVAMESLRARGQVLTDSGRRSLRLDDVWWTTFALPLPFPAIGPQVPLFGYPDATEGRFGVTRPGELGLAFGSPLLALEGGQRLVTLTLRLSALNPNDLALPAPGSEAVSLPEAVRRTLEQALSWHYTTATGLEALNPAARILSDASPSTDASPSAGASPAEPCWLVDLAFSLPPSAPPWQGCPRWGDQPLLLGRLRAPTPSSPTPSADAPSPLAILSLLRALEIHLAVEVRGLPPQHLQSSLGRLDPSQPLPLFGPSPVCGAFFVAGAPELADKPLEELRLRLHWHGLPISREGFRGHYSAYRVDGDGQLHPPGELFNNDSFRVDLGLERPLPPTEGDSSPTITLPLFPPGEASGPNALAPSTTLVRPELKGLTGVRGLRLVLSAPPQGFGDALYAINCLEASRQLATSKPSDSPPVWPNPPWCPNAASVELDYRCAKVVLTPGSATPDHPLLRVFHLSPLTGPQPVTWSGAPDLPLCPSVLPPAPPSATASPLPAGDLQVGVVLLTLSAPLRQLSLLFGLTTAAAPSPASPLPPPPAATGATAAALTVEAWDGSAWWALPDNAVQDGTSALSRTGLLRLTLPENQTTARLRLRVTGLGATLPDLICLEANAVSATWQGPGGRQGLNRSLPAGSVTAALTNVPGIAEVRQPMPSTGGVAPASADMQKVCLAERLRHKDRAVQAEDYAVLLLRAFPVLWQVAVLPAQTASGESAPGTVTIIPLPGPEAPTVPDPTIPSCDAAFGERLVRELQPRVSPFVRLRVASPPYCRIRVCAAVVVEEARLASALQQLQTDLVRFLSPWPAPDLGPRPKNYHEEAAISQFIRDRPYIKSINTLKLLYEGDAAASDPAQAPRDTPPTGSHIYFTSALRHALTPCLTRLASTSGLEGG